MRVDAGTPDPLAVHADNKWGPALAADGDTVYAAWSDFRSYNWDIYAARSDDGTASFTAPAQLDDSKAGFDPDTGTPTNQWHPSLAADRDRLFVAWQDDRLGNNDIFFTTSTDGGASFAPAERVDDTGTGASGQTRPQLALGGSGRGRRCYVAWEDDRGGDADVYLARRACPGGAAGR